MNKKKFYDDQLIEPSEEAEKHFQVCLTLIEADKLIWKAIEISGDQEWMIKSNYPIINNIAKTLESLGYEINESGWSSSGLSC